MGSTRVAYAQFQKQLDETAQRAEQAHRGLVALTPMRAQQRAHFKHPRDKVSAIGSKTAQSLVRQCRGSAEEPLVHGCTVMLYPTGALQSTLLACRCQICWCAGVWYTTRVCWRSSVNQWLPLRSSTNLTLMSVCPQVPGAGYWGCLSGHTASKPLAAHNPARIILHNAHTLHTGCICLTVAAGGSLLGAATVGLCAGGGNHQDAVARRSSERQSTAADGSARASCTGQATDSTGGAKQHRPSY